MNCLYYNPYIGSFWNNFDTITFNINNLDNICYLDVSFLIDLQLNLILNPSNQNSKLKCGFNNFCFNFSYNDIQTESPQTTIMTTQYICMFFTFFVFLCFCCLGALFCLFCGLRQSFFLAIFFIFLFIYVL